MLFLSLLAVGCRQTDSGTEVKEDMLVSVGDTALYLNDVLSLMPYGLSPEDSVEMFHRIVDDWIEYRVLEEVAKDNIIDLERIDRLTRRYRNRLIVDEYLRLMGENGGTEVSKRSVDSYYSQYGDSMYLRQPLVKGIFLKTSQKDSELSNLRKWIASGSEKEIDELEKNGLKEASGYEYFIDKWVEWDRIASQIPYRIEDADEFLKKNRDFETAYCGSVYLLHIEDYLPSGSKMPSDYAKGRIREYLSGRSMDDYRRNLKHSIYMQALKDGKLKKGSYDPMGSKSRVSNN